MRIGVVTPSYGVNNGIKRASFKRGLRRRLPDIPERQLESIKEAIEGNPFSAKSVEKSSLMGWIQTENGAELVQILREASDKYQKGMKNMLARAADNFEEALV